MSRRKRLSGKAEEIRQVAEALRREGLPEPVVRGALLAMCGVNVLASMEGVSWTTSRQLGREVAA